MNKWLTKQALKRLLKRPCPDRIPRTGKDAKSINCFSVRFDRDTEPLFFARAIVDEEVDGLDWDGGRYSIPVKRNLTDLMSLRLDITHYLPNAEIRFTNSFNYWLHAITRLSYLKIAIMTVTDKLMQFLFNRRSLIVTKKIQLLSVLLENSYDLGGFSGPRWLNVFTIMDLLYTRRWIAHTNGDAKRASLELFLDSLHCSGDVEKDGPKYRVRPQALQTLESYYEGERRHRQTLRVQITLAVLTGVLAALALLQSGIIKVDPIWTVTWS